ncbi:MAG: hypothetical protein AAF587_33175 [Bacteroidota bacterium]
MRINVCISILSLALFACSPSEVSPSKNCEATVSFVEIQCVTRLPIVEFEDGNLGEITNPKDFPDIFDENNEPLTDETFTIGWERVAEYNFEYFVICNKARTPTNFIRVLCLNNSHLPD